MKRFKLKSLILALAAVAIAVPMASAPAFANSGPPWEEGVTSTGIHCVHETSVLEVQNETLTFNIGTPLYELTENEKYNTTVTAEYTFYNPTEDTVNTKMAFPIGLIPYYVEGVEKSDKISKIENPITVNGQPVEYSVRHTYGTYNSFEEDVKKLKDTYYETDFFKTDLPVTEYVFKVNLTTDNEYATFKVKMPQSTGTRYFGNTDLNGNFVYNMYNGGKFSIFVLGEDLDISDLNWSITRYSSLFERDIQVNGSVTLEKKMEPKTFKSYVLQGYDSQSEVSEVDFYNAMFDLIYTDGVWAGYGTTPTGTNFTEWYVYETSVEPGGTFTNAVTAMLYPTVYYYYRPYIYEYNYYLSPAKEWAAFGELTINIITKQNMQKGDFYNPDDAENSKFQKTETGYTATFTSLPTTELSFKMCSSETPGVPEYYSGVDTASLVIAIILGVFFVGGPLVVGLVMLIIFLVKRKKDKKKAVSEPPVATPDPAAAPDLTPVADDIEDGIVGGADNSEINTGENTDNSASQEANGEAAIAQQSKNNFCAYCGSKLDGDVKFCPNCGGAVQSEKPVQPVQPIQSIQPVLNNGKRVNGFGIAGFVLSIITLFAMSSPISILFLVTAFGLSLTGVILRKKYQGVYGLAIAGLAISSAIIFTILAVAFFSVLGFIICY